MIDILFLLTGLLIGFIAAWFIAKYKYTSLDNSVPFDQIKIKYVAREIFDALQLQSDMHREDLIEKEQELRKTGMVLSAKEQEILNLEEKLEIEHKNINGLQEQFKVEFENIANRLLDENSQKFAIQNQQQIGHILSPLKEQIKVFETGIEKRYLEKTKDLVSLKKEIEHLRDLNMQLSEDANNLANALKGESKVQGDWGEHRLEMLLEKAGLVKDIHFTVQPSFKDVNGKDKRPDFIINLPEQKHLVIDSKVSLVAYERYYSADKSKKKEKFLKAHLDSIRSHFKDLSHKNYQHLYQINSPDYLLMFVPIEPAFNLAVQSDSKLFLDALDKNIVMVTTSTLLATMRTVSYIWKQEKQKRSVLEIGRQSGLLYDKFCNFVDDLQAIGSKIDSAQNAYNDAFNKLVDSKKYGDTLVGRAEKIKELGAKTSKSLPKELLERAGKEGSKNGKLK